MGSLNWRISNFFPYAKQEPPPLGEAYSWLPGRRDLTDTRKRMKGRIPQLLIRLALAVKRNGISTVDHRRTRKEEHDRIMQWAVSFRGLKRRGPGGI